jgi:Group II intron, maturase-specific domain
MAGLGEVPLTGVGALFSYRILPCPVSWPGLAWNRSTSAILPHRATAFAPIQAFRSAWLTPTKRRDDFVVLCRSAQEAAEALAVVRGWTARAGLTLHPVKTKLVHARNDGFDVLGYHFERGRRWPRKKSMEALKDTIRAKTRWTVGHGLARVIADVNPTLKGWYGYFQHSYHPAFRMVDGRVRRRLRSILRQQKGVGGSRRTTELIKHDGQLPSFPIMACSACRTPMMRPASPLGGKTADWRAGCGRSASPVRREREALPHPTPITT